MPTTETFLTKRNVYLVGIFVLVLVVVALLLFVGFSNKQAEVEPDQVAHNAAQDSAKSENPFKADNPLSGVEANPFEKTKKVLNPFEN